MKLLSAFLLLASMNAFADDSIINPTLLECDKTILRNYKKPVGRTATTIPTNIKIEPREIDFGDPAIWSLIHMIKIEFPVARTGKKACFLLDKAFLNSAKSIGYDAQKGRLIKLNLSVATGDEHGTIGSKEIDLKLRVNQASGTVDIEK